jgi:hypothetical protein
MHNEFRLSILGQFADLSSTLDHGERAKSRTALPGQERPSCRIGVGYCYPGYHEPSQSCGKYRNQLGTCSGRRREIHC